MSTQKLALIIGAGPGISGQFGVKLGAAGYKVLLASRSAEKLASVAALIPDSEILEVDCGDNASIVKLFTTVDEKFGGQAPDVVLYNPSGGNTASGDGSVGTFDYNHTVSSMQISAIGAFVTAQEAGKRMLPRQSGAIFFTGATAGVKAFPKRGVFAMGKFALRGMAQSMYKELSPQGIHVAHFVIDGGVRPYTQAQLESFFGKGKVSLISTRVYGAYMISISHMIGLRFLRTRKPRRWRICPKELSRLRPSRLP